MGDDEKGRTVTKNEDKDRHYQFSFARIHVSETNALKAVFWFEVLALSKQRFDIQPFTEGI